MKEQFDTMLVSIKDIEKAHIENILKMCRYNKTLTAIKLGISRGSLQSKLKQYFGDEYVNTRSKLK